MTAYIYDGTLPGLLTAVFTAYERKEQPYVIAEEEGLQTVFGQEAASIAAREDLAVRVEDGIRKKMGQEGYDSVWTAFLSHDGDKATKIYRYIRIGMKLGRAVHDHLTHDDVLAVVSMNRHTGSEAHKLKGFARFALMENGVYYSRITPKNNVLPIIMPHFADRMSVQPFLIYDEAHRLAGVYDMKSWYLVEADELNLPDYSEDEKQWQGLWKKFYDTIAIKERVNHKLRMSLMPKRYWRNMTETLI
jgi:probable DNA metabolism protein